jgi:hypothetical protein
MAATELAPLPSLLMRAEVHRPFRVEASQEVRARAGWRSATEIWAFDTAFCACRCAPARR